MRKEKAIFATLLAATMLFGCGSSGDESVTGLSVEKLENVPQQETVVEEETIPEEK